MRFKFLQANVTFFFLLFSPVDIDKFRAKANTHLLTLGLVIVPLFLLYCHFYFSYLWLLIKGTQFWSIAISFSFTLDSLSWDSITVRMQIKAFKIFVGSVPFLTPDYFVSSRPCLRRSWWMNVPSRLASSSR